MNAMKKSATHTRNDPPIAAGVRTFALPSFQVLVLTPAIAAAVTCGALALSSSEALAGFRDVQVTSVVYNEYPASGGDFPSPAQQVAYITLENRSDQWAGSGVECDLSTGHDCLSHALEISLAGKTVRVDTNTIAPRQTARVAVSLPAGTLSHCLSTRVSIVGTFQGDKLWAMSNRLILVTKNGSLTLCRVFPSPLPVPAFPPFPFQN